MNSFYAYHTDVGTKKKTNQDSLLIKEAETEEGNILLMVVCDGMGGLDKGEVASASLIAGYDRWFQEQLPYSLSQQDPRTCIREQWDELIQKMNLQITNYGVAKGIQLGTTLTAILFLENGEYIIAHVGDTRAYHISDASLEILTIDQTFVAREVEEGRMTEEEAMNDPRRNMLLQCVGASQHVDVDFEEGKAEVGDIYMLCCDGFRHVITNDEIRMTLQPSVCASAEISKNQMIYLTELNKQRGEVDNITVLLAKVW